MALTDKLTAIADAIRGKTGKGDALTLDQMPAEIEGIKTEPALEALAVTENGEFLPPDGVDGFSSVAVNVPVPAPVVQPLSVTENGTYTAPSGVDGYNPVTVNVAGSGGDEWEEFLIAQIGNDKTFPVTKLPEGVTVIQASKFEDWTNLNLTSLPDGITHIWGRAFKGCTKLSTLSMPSRLQELSNYAFRDCTGLTEVAFNSKLNFMGSSVFTGCTNLLTINVPWAEGEVSNAPWGATSATINYNYTGG